MLPRMYRLLERREIVLKNSPPLEPHRDVSWMMEQLQLTPDGDIRLTLNSGLIVNKDTLYEAVVELDQ